MWFIYILRCADDTLYTGIAKDVARRVAEHNDSRRLAARYTRSRRPVELVYQESAKTRSAASRREYAIKRMTRRQKLSLVKAGSDHGRNPGKKSPRAAAAGRRRA